MKRKSWMYGFILYILSLSLIYIGFLLHQKNEKLTCKIKMQTGISEQLQCAQKMYEATYYPWELSNLEGIQEEIQKFLQSDFITLQTCEFLPKMHKNAIDGLHYYQGYATCFVLYEHCLIFLQKLTALKLPLWITSLSMQRNHADNYGLQFSMFFKIAVKPKIKSSVEAAVVIP